VPVRLRMLTFLVSVSSYIEPPRK